MSRKLEFSTTTNTSLDSDEEKLFDKIARPARISRWKLIFRHRGDLTGRSGMSWKNKDYIFLSLPSYLFTYLTPSRITNILSIHRIIVNVFHRIYWRYNVFFFLLNFSNIKIQIITEMCYQLVVEVEKWFSPLGGVSIDQQILDTNAGKRLS
jgi:hypothetical protein